MNGNAVVSTEQGDQIIEEGSAIQMNEDGSPVIMPGVVLTQPAKFNDLKSQRIGKRN